MRPRKAGPLGPIISSKEYFIDLPDGIEGGKPLLDGIRGPGGLVPAAHVEEGVVLNVSIEVF